jgi:hypothetical protein
MLGHCEGNGSSIAPCTSATRAQRRRVVGRCFRGASRSCRNIASIAGVNASTHVTVGFRDMSFYRRQQGCNTVTNRDGS